MVYVIELLSQGTQVPTPTLTPNAAGAARVRRPLTDKNSGVKPPPQPKQVNPGQKGGKHLGAKDLSLQRVDRHPLQQQQKGSAAKQVGKLLQTGLKEGPQVA